MEEGGRQHGIGELPCDDQRVSVVLGKLASKALHKPELIGPLAQATLDHLIEIGLHAFEDVLLIQLFKAPGLIQKLPMRLQPCT